MKEEIIYYLLQMKMYIFKALRYIRYRLIAISEVICMIDGQMRYMTARFTIIRILKYVQSVLQRFVNILDANVQKAQLIKNYPDGQQTVIVCPKTVDKHQLMISDIVDITNTMNETKDDRMGNNIYMKFELECPVNGTVNLKDHLITYKDIDKLYSHTLNNVLTFNNLQASTDAKINIKIFSSGKLITKSLLYEDCKDMHISEFNSNGEQ